MNEHIDNWKNKKVFFIQLQHNLEELKQNYPHHWDMFLKFNNFILNQNPNVLTILDVACGCGTYYELCRKHVPWLKYTGMDYAEEAVSLAKEHWNYPNFFVKNYKDLTKEEISKYDILHACSLHNVLPNGDEALEFFLQLEPKYLILGKLLTTHEKSNYRIYKAYNELETYLYYHNIDNIKRLFKQYNYNAYVEQSDLPTEYLLIKK